MICGFHPSRVVALQDFLRRRIPGADTGELPNGWDAHVGIVAGMLGEIRWEKGDLDDDDDDRYGDTAYHPAKKPVISPAFLGARQLLH